MNENINLCEILKDCPKRTKLYSPLFGGVTLHEVSDPKNDYPISVKTQSGNIVMFNRFGIYNSIYVDTECILFPSKTQRDWSKWICPKPNKPKFDPKTLKPFDRVLVIDSDRYWTPVLFDHLEYSLDYPRMYCFDHMARKVIPYNDDTKHLVGTSNEAPDYYRYWE